MVKRILVGSLLMSSNLWAATSIQTLVEPQVSYQGEPIYLKITVQTETPDSVTPPDTSVLNDWSTQGTSQEDNTSSRIMNGQIVTRFRQQFTYELAPKKAGKLRIPPLPVKVGNRSYLTEEAFVEVKTMGVLTRPSVIDEPQNFQAPKGESFFIKATPNKTKAYVGELLLLNYELYLRNVHLNNPELRKFPDFNGFLKEELFIAKQFQFVTELFKGEYLRKADLIRYALFPLREGRIKIQSLTFNTEVLVPNSFGQVQSIPMEKQSNTVEIDVKPLPPPPSGLISSGGVGQFQLTHKVPSETLYAKVPFTLEFTISGLGNIKSLAAPTLNLPPEFELVQNKESFEYRADATGEKTFQYLILPKAPGLFKIPSFQWTYFDPQKGSYVTLMSQELSLSIQAALKGQESENTKTLKPQEPKTVYGTLQWKTFNRNYFWETLFVSLSAVIFGFWAFLNFMEWKKAKEDLTHLLTPWIPIERRIQTAIDKKQEALVATLMDEWIRVRWAAHMKESGALPEWTREELLQHSESCGQPLLPKSLERLNKFWGTLDALRYPREKSKANLGELKTSFESIQNLWK